MTLRFRMLFDAMKTENEGDCQIHFSEVVLFKAAMSGTSKDRLDWIFKIYDSDGDGKGLFHYIVYII